MPNFKIQYFPISKHNLTITGENSQAYHRERVYTWLYQQNEANAAMPSSFPGVALSELQALNDSPDPTPHHTRASSLDSAYATVRPYSKDEGHEFVANLRRLSEEGECY